jgi:hypothetical protein
MTGLTPGTVIHGFCSGYFGRDSYACRAVEATGRDWIVTRNSVGVELGTDLENIAKVANDRSYCSEACTGNGELGED